MCCSSSSRLSGFLCSFMSVEVFLINSMTARAVKLHCPPHHPQWWDTACTEKHTHIKNTHSLTPLFTKHLDQNESDSGWATIPTVVHRETHTHTLLLRHTNRIPGVQSDSSEPEGTKTFTQSLSSPWRQQVMKLHNKSLRNYKHTLQEAHTPIPFLLLCVCNVW